MRLFFILFILPIFCFSQQIKWGGFNTYQGNTIEIIQNKNSFFTLRNKKKFIFNSVHISKFNEFNQLYSEKIHRKIGGSAAKVVGFELLNNQPIVFLADEYHTKNILYIQRINEQGLPGGPAIEVMQYEMPKSWFNKGSFSFTLSKNKEFVLVSYSFEIEKNKKKTIGYQIIDKNLNIKSKGRLTFDQEESSLYDYTFELLNNGEFYLLKKINKAQQGILFSSYQQITNIELSKIISDSIIPIPINSQNLKFIDININSNDSQLSIAGLFTRDESSYKIEGTYYFNYDISNNKVINEGNTGFSTDFITQNWSERARKRAFDREAKGKESPALYEYYIKGVIPQKDSSLIFLLEQYYVSTITYTDPRTGYISTRYIYHYNDIIIGKVSSKNEIEWMKMIPKSQVSENDGGYLSSFSYYSTNEKLVLYFNDAATYYDKMGQYKEKSDFVLFSSLRRILATVELDLKTGNYIRKNSEFIKKRNEFSIPKLFSNNSEAQTFILFLRKGKKENFGVIKY